MHIHIERFDGKLEEQRRHRIAPARQRIAITRPHSAGQRPVLHRPAIDEQIDGPGRRAVHCRQADHAAKANIAAARIDADGLVTEGAPHHGGKAACPAIAVILADIEFTRARRQVKQGPAVRLESEADLRPCHRQAAHHIKAAPLLGPLGLQEFETCRHGLEQLADGHASASVESSRLRHANVARIDGDLPGFGRALLHRGNLEPRYGADRGQRLAAKSEKPDVVKAAIRQL